MGEMLKFGADLVQGVHASLADDGKIGVFDTLKLTATLGREVVAAFGGLKEVKDELVHLDAEGVEVLGDIIWPAFAGSPSHQRDLLNATLGAVRELVNLYRVYVDPPKAHVVE